MADTAPASLRWARVAIAATISRSRSRSATGAAGGTGCSSSRRLRRYNSGLSSSRCRAPGPAPRQAAYSCPASRVLHRPRAKTSAIRWQSSTLARATGTSTFIAMCAAIFPSRTHCWMPEGRISTRASRLLTQLTSRSKRRASSSASHPATSRSSASSQPCSSAVSASPSRSERSRSSASAWSIGQTTARTVSRPSFSSAPIRL